MGIARTDTSAHLLIAPFHMTDKGIRLEVCTLFSEHRHDPVPQIAQFANCSAID